MMKLSVPFLSAAALALAAPAFAETAPSIGMAAVKTEGRTVRGNLVLQNVPATPPEVRERLRQYVSTRGAAFLDFLPDGGVLISTRFGDAAQVHVVDQPMGMRRQLTFYNEPIGGAIVQPGGSGAFLFGKDQGGDEFFQGFLFDRATGKATRFTQEKTRNQSLVWRDDGKEAAWAEATAQSPDYTIMAGDPAKPESRRVLYKGKGAVAPVDYSGDGKSLLLSEYVSITKSRLFTLDLASGAVKEINPQLNVSYDGGEFTPDGKSILTISDEGSDFQRLVRIDVATGARTPVSAPINWDVEQFDLSADGQRIAYSVNVAGASELKLLDARTGRTLATPTLPAGVIGGLEFDDGSAQLGFTLNSATAPSDVYVYSVRGGKLTRWTQSEVGGLDPAGFVAPTLARFPTFDSATGGPKEITAWVYAPKGPGPHPAIIDIHGGPEGQSRPTFNSRIQYWVNELGVAVVLPNVRGSTGYGKTFVEMDNALKRLDSVKDIGATLDWMGTQKATFDMSRVVAYGGSYGGYMVYASMIEYPERFAAGVDIVGISDFRTFLERTMGYRRDLRRAEYGDERKPEVAAYFDKIAPLKNADKIKRPMFVVHGANDPRVPVSEAEQMIAAFEKNGLKPWVMIANDEGHGFAKRPNQEAQREAETLFFQDVLKLKK